MRATLSTELDSYGCFLLADGDGYKLSLSYLNNRNLGSTNFGTTSTIISCHQLHQMLGSLSVNAFSVFLIDIGGAASKQ